MFYKHEMKVIKKIRQYAKNLTEAYYFWFVYDDNEQAIDWEGGIGLNSSTHFRNDYVLPAGKGGQIQKNIFWSTLRAGQSIVRLFLRPRIYEVKNI